MTLHRIIVNKGQVLPRVTTVQVLMRRHRPGTMINCDGNFGPKTESAVRAFQRFHKLRDDGVVGNLTWGSIETVSGFTILDVVDNTEFSEVEANDIRSAGGSPIEVFGMSNGVDVVTSIIAKAAPGSVALLRIHGHGTSGVQGLTAGESDGIPHLSDIGLKNFSKIEIFLKRIAPVFVGFGSVELHGCDVGAGTVGRSLLDRLAAAWGVPVTAGIRTQISGGRHTFQFEGPTVTGFPAGGTLKSWSALQQSSFGMVTMAT